MKRLTRNLLLAALALAALAIALFRLTHHDDTVHETTLQPPVSLATVRDGTVSERIAIAGRVGSPAGTQTKLSFGVPGSVAGIDVRLGERVDAGAALARLDATPYTLAAQQAQAEASAAGEGSTLASVDRVSVKLHVDEAELARQERLYGAGVVALRDVQAAKATVAADRADAESARVQLAQALAQSKAAALHAAGTRYDASRTTLRAPAAGTVVGVYVQRGQTVEPATAVVALSSERQGVATLDVPVAQLARIEVGDRVELRSSAARWSGRVAGIAPAVDPATGLAIVSVAGVPDGTPAGTPVDAAVIAGEARGLVIPAGAIVEDPQTGAQLVFVWRPGGGASNFAARRVTVDVRDDRFARVTSGLRAGERIAAEGAVDLLARPD